VTVFSRTLIDIKKKHEDRSMTRRECSDQVESDRKSVGFSLDKSSKLRKDAAPSVKKSKSDG
jgi:hypothetical protein